MHADSISPVIRYPFLDDMSKFCVVWTERAKSSYKNREIDGVLTVPTAALPNIFERWPENDIEEWASEFNEYILIDMVEDSGGDNIITELYGKPNVPWVQYENEFLQAITLIKLAS